MQTFIIGFCGALALVVLVSVGALVGWTAHKRIIPEPPTLHETERQALKDQQEAFETIQNYSIERAYGLLDQKEKFGGDGA